MTDANEKEHDYDTFIEKNGVKVIDCKSCGFRHIFPLPSQEELLDYYEGPYSDPIEKINIEDIFNTISKLLPATNEFEKRRVLDLGAGDGSILKYFNNRGWQTCGIELHTELDSEECESLGMIMSCFDDLDWNELGRFDAVILSFVLEHVRNPLELLANACKVMKPGGIIYMEVPNDFNELQETMHEELGVERWWIVTPDHLNYFNRNSLRHLAERAGFRDVLIGSSFPVEMFALMGDNYVEHPEVGKRVHQKRLRFEKHLRESGRNDLRRKIYQKLIEIGVGRSIIYYGTKPNNKVQTGT